MSNFHPERLFNPNASNQLGWIPIPESFARAGAAIAAVILVHANHFNVCETHVESARIGLHDWSSSTVETFASFDEFAARIELPNLQGLIFVREFDKVSVENLSQKLRKFCTDFVVTLGSTVCSFQYGDDDPSTSSSNTGTPSATDLVSGTAVGSKRRMTSEGLSTTSFTILGYC
jgi:hypothetical protein